MKRRLTMARIRVDQARARATVQLKLWALVIAGRLLRFGLSQRASGGRPEA